MAWLELQEAQRTAMGSCITRVKARDGHSAAVGNMDAGEKHLVRRFLQEPDTRRGERASCRWSWQWWEVPSGLERRTGSAGFLPSVREGTGKARADVAVRTSAAPSQKIFTDATKLRSACAPEYAFFLCVGVVTERLLQL